MGQQQSKLISFFNNQINGSTKKQIQKLHNMLIQKDIKINQLQQYQQAIRNQNQISLKKKQNYFAQILNEKIKISHSQFEQLKKKHFQQKAQLQNNYVQNISLISNKLTEIIKQKNQIESIKKDIIYQNDPQIQKQLQQIKKINHLQLEQLKKINNPEKLKQIKDNQFKNYLEYLRTKNWLKNSQYEKQRHHAVVGDISSGKSTCLNYFFGLKQQTGIDETTLQARIVYKQNNICIWDTPGICEQFDLMNYKNLQLFAMASKVFMLFDKSLKCCKQCLQVIAAVRKNKDLFIIRTMGDKFQSNNQFQKAIHTDKQLLTEWNLKDVPLYTISAMKDLTFQDNLIVKYLLQK